MRGPLATALGAALSLLILISPALARKKRTLPSVDWKLTVSEAAVYNDNVLGLSQKDLDAARISPSTFPTPLKTVDDYQNEIQIRPEIRWRAPLKTMVTADYRFRTINRAKNGFTDYQSHSVGVSVRPRVAGYNWAAAVRAMTIPSYYLRVYRDRDYVAYDAARFRNWDYEASFKYRFYQPLWLTARTGYGTYYYNRKFTEYDSKYWEFGGAAAYDLPWNVTVNAGYIRRLSDNIGKNQSGIGMIALSPDETGDSEYGNADFHEDEIDLGATAFVPWIKIVRTEASLNYRFRRRVYTSDVPLWSDPFHRSRLDRRGELTGAIKVSLTRAFDVQAYAGYEIRRTDSDHPTVPLDKDFMRHEYGLMFSYSI